MPKNPQSNYSVNISLSSYKDKKKEGGRGRISIKKKKKEADDSVHSETTQKLTLLISVERVAVRNKRFRQPFHEHRALELEAPPFPFHSSTSLSCTSVFAGQTSTKQAEKRR